MNVHILYIHTRYMTYLCTHIHEFTYIHTYWYIYMYMMYVCSKKTLTK